MQARIASAAFTSTMLLLGAAQVQAQTLHPFVHLETAYQYVDGATSVAWGTCGYTSGGDGCYGGGTLGPFNDVCAVARLNSLVVIADAGATLTGGKRSVAKLYLYKEKNGNGFLIQPFVGPSVTLVRTITLDVTAKQNSTC